MVLLRVTSHITNTSAQIFLLSIVIRQTLHKRLDDQSLSLSLKSRRNHQETPVRVNGKPPIHKPQINLYSFCWSSWMPLAEEGMKINGTLNWNEKPLLGGCRFGEIFEVVGARIAQTWRENSSRELRCLSHSRITNLLCNYQLAGLGAVRLQGPSESSTSLLLDELLPRLPQGSFVRQSLCCCLLVPHPAFALPLFSDVTPGALSRPRPQALHQSLQFLIGQQRGEGRAFYFALPSSFLVFS